MGWTITSNELVVCCVLWWLQVFLSLCTVLFTTAFRLLYEQYISSWVALLEAPKILASPTFCRGTCGLQKYTHLLYPWLFGVQLLVCSYGLAYKYYRHYHSRRFPIRCYLGILVFYRQKRTTLLRIHAQKFQYQALPHHAANNGTTYCGSKYTGRFSYLVSSCTEDAFIGLR